MKTKKHQASTLAISSALLLFVASAVWAERPGAPELLPEDTLALLRITDTKELAEKFKMTSLGQILQDEKVRPMIGQLYGSAAEAYQRVEERVGLSLDDLLSLPQGEIFLALVAPEDARPALVMLMDAGDHIGVAKKLVERIQTAVEDRGAAYKTETVDDTELNIYADPNRDERTVVFFEREATTVVATNLDVAKSILSRWNGQDDEEDSLADNRQYTTIMSRCRGTKDERPQVMWYVDPIELVKRASRGNTAAEVGLAILPALGLDGLQAVGGSMIFAPEEFDSILHFHVKLDSPRSGIIKMLALDSGNSTPEAWVPPDVYTYSTFHWDVNGSFATLKNMYNSFRGDEALEGELVKRFKDPLGIDLEEEVLDQLDGRVTLISWFEPPVRANSESRLFAFKLKDADAFRHTLEKVLDTVPPERREEKTFGGVTYYQGEERSPRNPLRRRRPRERNRDNDAERRAERPRPTFRRPRPCVAIVDDYLMISGSPQLLENVIRSKSDATSTLAAESDFKLISDKIKRQIGGGRPGLVHFNRPDKAFQFVVDLLGSDDTRNFLGATAENNPVFRAFHETLTDNELPTFEELSKYISPSGGMMTNDETGFHFIGFTLKRE